MAEDRGGILTKIADSNLGKLFGTYVAPFLVVILGYFIQDKLAEINSTNKSLWQALSRINDTQNEIKTNQAVSAKAFESHQHEDQVFEDATKFTLQDHEARIRALQSTPLPRIK